MVGNTNVRRWNEDEAHMDEGLYHRLAQKVSDPVVAFIEGVHYSVKPSTQVLSQEVAIPGTSSVSEPTLLVMR